jgi:hypothetical protein
VAFSGERLADLNAQMLAVNYDSISISFGLEKILEIRGRREEQGAMQDIFLRTFIAVFHLGAYFARMLSGEVQCSNDDVAVRRPLT